MVTPLQEEFETLVQERNFVQADRFIYELETSERFKLLSRSEALNLLYRIGYVNPKQTLNLCRLRDDVPKPFIDILCIELGFIPPLRFYQYADTLVAVKIALMRKQDWIARFLLFRFYRQYNLSYADIVTQNHLQVGNNKLSRKIYERYKTIDRIPKISIIVTTYNSAQFIDRCLKSLINQTHNNLEIIVVDDASTDDTLRILDSYTNIKVIALKINRGTYFARNIGIEHATGDYIAFQDSDDWSHPQRLSVQLKSLDNKQLVANFSYFFRVNESTGLPDCRQKYPLLRLNLSSMLIQSDVIKFLNGFDAKQRVESDKKFKLMVEQTYGCQSIGYVKKPLAIGAYRKQSLTTDSLYGFNKYGYSLVRNLV